MNGFARIAPVSKWPTLATALLVTILAAGFLVQSWTVDDSVYARGSAGADITLETVTDERLVVLASPALVVATGRPPVVTCGEDGTVRVRHQMLSSGERELEGRTYAYLGLLSAQWEPGDVLHCTGEGVEEIIVVTDRASSARTAGLLIAGAAAVLWIWTGITFAVARRAREGRERAHE